MEEIKRTRFKKFKLYDAISRTPEKHGYTSVSNSFIRDPKIDGVSKTILTILLSNKDGWTSSVSDLRNKMKEGRDAIENGIKHLIKHGYFLHIRYRDKKTKVLKGSFWAYTDVAYNFNYHKNVKILEKKGYEIVRSLIEKAHNTDETFVGDVNDSIGKTMIKNNRQRKVSEKAHNTRIPQRGKPATNNTIIIKKNKSSRTPPLEGVPSDEKKRENSLPLSKKDIPVCKKGYTDETFPDDEGETCHTCQFHERCTFFD
jgi:biotin operon repressor